MLALLGFTTFELLAGFTADSSRHSASYAKHDVIAGKPRLQATGSDLSTRRLSIRLHHKISSPSFAYSTLKIAMDLQQPLPLVFGGGSFDGLYVIKSIDDKTLITDDGGKVLARECTIALTEYPMSASSLLSMISPTNLLGIAGSQLPVAAVASVASSISQSGSAILTAVATYQRISQGVSLLSGLLNSGADTSNVAGELQTFFADLATQTAACYHTVWSNDWLGLDTAMVDFHRFNAQAANQYTATFPSLLSGDNEAAAKGLTVVAESLAESAKPAQKMTAWISIRGGVS